MNDRYFTKKSLVAASPLLFTTPEIKETFLKCWDYVTPIPIDHPMAPIFAVVLLQALMGGFDNIYHHEVTERLPWKITAHREQVIHCVRGGLYTVVFLSLAGIQPQGIYATGLMGILVIEALLTLYDFVTEDRTRKLPATERVTHTLLTLNYGVFLTLFYPILSSWAQQPNGIELVNYGIFSALNYFVAAGVCGWAFRDHFAAARLAKFAKLPPPTVSLLKKQRNILVTGGSGFIGSALCKSLLLDNHHVFIVTRNKVRTQELFKSKTYTGTVTLLDSVEQLHKFDDIHFDVIINLAGEPLASWRWNAKQKEKLMKSRIEITEQLVNYMANAKQKPEVFISSSAIGFYGPGSVEDSASYTESSAPSNVDSFSHKICSTWETTAKRAEDYGVRVVFLRTGIVLDRDGGVMSKLLFPFEFCLGGKFGSGKQWMSWIHLHDLLSIVGFVINNPQISGPVNATAPNPVTNEQFTSTLASVMRRLAFFTQPGFLLKILFGRELSNELFLYGQKILPAKLLSENFTFKYSALDSALKEVAKGDPPRETGER